MIKLITLDLDNTLWDIDPVIVSAEKKMRAWIAEHIPEAVAFMELDKIKGTYKQLVKQHPELSHHPTQLRKRILYHAFIEANVPTETAKMHSEDAFQIFYRERNRITLFHQAETVLHRISQKFPIIALSNGNANLELIGIDHFFTAHFSAETEGKPKPHNNMFLKALEVTGVLPQETIHVGDHAEVDINAAKALGFHTIWFNQDNMQYVNLCQPTLMIHQITQLPEAISRINQSVTGSTDSKKTPVNPG